jgi:hydrogenase maturation protease
LEEPGHACPSDQAAHPKLLIFGFGNPARGDDALGPLLLERLESRSKWECEEYLTDFQLQVEHALDLQGRDLVLFIDAHLSCCPPFRLQALSPAHDLSYTTHAMSPASLLQVYLQVFGVSPPPSFLLSIRGMSFELGDGLSTEAQCHLEAALKFAERLVASADPLGWREQCNRGEP